MKLPLKLNTAGLARRLAGGTLRGLFCVTIAWAAHGPTAAPAHGQDPFDLGDPFAADDDPVDLFAPSDAAGDTPPVDLFAPANSAPANSAPPADLFTPANGLGDDQLGDDQLSDEQLGNEQLGNEPPQPLAAVHTQATRFAPGVVNVIDPAPQPEETFSGPVTLQSLIDAHPEIEWNAPHFSEGRPHFDPRSRTLIEMARQVTLRREIYCLEFSFKPLRMIYVDVPQANGTMARKLVWYMVYRLRYRGHDLRPATEQVGDSPVYKRVEAVSYQSRRGFPMLVLEDYISDKQYLDRVLPAVKQRIALREQITAPLYDSVEITTVDIPRSDDPDADGVWGLATWEDIDPQTKFFSVYVYGLTNAFEQDGEGGNAPYRKKALRLNFYRPGDTMNQIDDLIRFGVPPHQDAAEQAYVLQQYGIDKRLDYDWVFR